MPTLAHRPFVKMNGLGNEILVLDLRDAPVDIEPAELRALARAEALPFDQAMVLFPPRRGDTAAFVRIYNNDGSESGACGNGTRCIAAYEARRTGTRHILFESEAGLLDCQVHDDDIVTVDMGAPRLSSPEIPLSHEVGDTAAVLVPGFEALGPASLVSMGNPHAVFFVPDADAVDVEGLGAALEHHPLFPARANISFASLTGPDSILLHVWERGAGRTRACGTAGCATAVSAARTGRTSRDVRVRLPGGLLTLSWRAGDDHVLMTGAVVFEFDGIITPALLGEHA